MVEKDDTCCEEEKIERPGLGWRTSLSILMGVGWLVFLILWLFFYAGNYTRYQNIAIALASLLAVGAILGIIWMAWIMKYRTGQEKEMMKTKGFWWRTWLSVVMFFGGMVFLIWWFFYTAENFSIYQNIAVLIVAILIVGGLLGAMWAPWGMKYGPEHSRHNSREAAYYHEEMPHKETEKTEKKTEKKSK